MKRAIFLLAAFELAGITAAVGQNKAAPATPPPADVMMLVSARPAWFSAYWSQLGTAGTPVTGPFSLSAGPIMINGMDSSAAVIEQEGNGFLGDFTKGDYVIETLYNLGVVSLQFTTGVSQAGAQFQPCQLCSSTYPIQAIVKAYDVNHNLLASYQVPVFNNNKEDGSAPYIGIEDLTGPNIYYLEYAQGFDGPWAINQLSITAPCAGLATPNLVQNPGFETGSGYNIPDWTVAWDSTADPYMFIGQNPHSGNNSMWLGSVPGENRISQVIQGTTAGSVYSICFWLANGSAIATTDGPNSIEVQWNDNDVLEMVNSRFFGYTYFSFNVVANGNNAEGEPTDTLVFQARQVPGFYNLDDVSVNLCAGCSFPPDPPPGTKPTH